MALIFASPASTQCILTPHYLTDFVQKLTFSTWICGTVAKSIPSSRSEVWFIFSLPIHTFPWWLWTHDLKLPNQMQRKGCSDAWGRGFSLFCWIWIEKYVTCIAMVSSKMKPKPWRAEKRDSKNLGLWWHHWAAGSINPRAHPISGITISSNKKSPYCLCQLGSFFFLLLRTKSILLILLKFLSPPAQNCPLRSRPSTLDHFRQYKTGWNSSCINRNYLDCISRFPLGKFRERDVCIPCLHFQVHSLLLLEQSLRVSPTCTSCHIFWFHSWARLDSTGHSLLLKKCFSYASRTSVFCFSSCLSKPAHLGLLCWPCSLLPNGT